MAKRNYDGNIKIDFLGIKFEIRLQKVENEF
jgi:hypothetical protein